MLQQGGLGGPYATLRTGALVSTALNTGGSLGVGTGIPADASSGHVFTATNHVLPLDGTLMWNSYWDGSEFRNWGANIAAFIGAGADGFTFSIGTAAGADQPSTFTDVMRLTVAGNLNLPLGTLTVARDPSGLMDVATLNWVSNNTVASFNNRIGQVRLNAADVYNALQLCDPIATQPWVNQAITAGLQSLLMTCPFVNRWNGRTGSVYLTLSDITCVFYQPGQQPVSPTPALTSNDDSIATTKWVAEYIANEFAGSGGNLATQSWVLANTVNSFNGRRGVVTLTTADVIDVGAAPLNSPNFSGVPTAPTAAVGQATGQIATTAFVQQAISANTAGVSTFNTRSGDVTLTNADIVAASGLANPSPNLTGAPTAPTAAPGTSSPQIANTQFVMAALANTVTSFNTRTGAITLTTADITGAGGAPLVSPNFSSVPTAPTAAPGTNTVQLATCAFVTQAVTASGGVSSFNGRTGAVDLIGNDISAAGGLVNPSVTLTGTPTAPTATAGTNSQQIATTAFVATALAMGTVTSFNTRTGAITLTGADIQTAGGALLAGPNFTGAPTAPTAPANTNNTQLATTQFVMAAILADTTGVTSFNTRTGAVVLTTADITGAGGATSASPQFTGIPQAPTATPGTNTTQLATTQFVQSAIASAGVASFNGRTGAVTLISNDISAAGGALLASPTFTGTPAAPTATAGTNTTQLATTAFVTTALGGATQQGPFLRLAGGVLSGPGNLGLGGVTMPGTLSAGSLISNGTGLCTVSNTNINANSYSDGTNWRRLLAGTAGAFVVNANGSYTWYNAVTGAANAIISWVQTMALDAAGHLTVSSFATGNDLQLLGTGGGAVAYISAASNVTNIIVSQSGGGNINAISLAALRVFIIGGMQRWNAYDGAQWFDVGCGGNNWFLTAGGGPIFTLSMSGDLTISGTLSQGSDARNKRHIADYRPGLAEVLRLTARQWEEQSGETCAGFVAQEVEDVLPEAVVIRDDGKLGLPGDAVAGALADHRHLRDGPILAALVNACREIDRSNAVLCERIEALEARMTQLNA